MVNLWSKINCGFLLPIDNFNDISNEVVETMPSVVSGGHRLFLIASHDEFNSPSISMHRFVENDAYYLTQRKKVFKFDEKNFSTIFYAIKSVD